MSTSRITITVDDDVLAELRQHAGPGETSAYIVEALRARLKRDPVEALLADLDERHGELTEDERREGEAWLDEVSRSIPPS